LDTPIIAGNSGGPVLNTAGKVVGIAVTGADRIEEAPELSSFHPGYVCRLAQ
jgi:hypothetical protein